MGSKPEQVFSLRTIREADHDAVLNLSLAADMGQLDLPDDVRVAVDERDCIIGFLRINRIDGASYVNPVVVDEAWRGHGVGLKLMEDALAREGDLLFVARGEAVGFYKRLGCDAVPWECIAPVIASDCDNCDRAHICNPLPMRMVHNPS